MFRLWGNRFFLFLIIFFNFVYVFSNSLIGKIEKVGNVYFFVTESKRYEIGLDKWSPKKYLNCRIELKDPKIVGNTITFDKYKILGGNNDASYWEILSQKLKKVDFDFNVYLDNNYLYFSLLVINKSETPVRFKFPSSEEVDFVVMDSNLKNTIWRWSWGKNFKIGYKSEVLLPHNQLKYYARWNYVRSYIEDGEYKVFAEFHSLPHGKISEVKSIIIKTPTKFFNMDEDFIPLSVGSTWKYLEKDDNQKFLEMKVTGTATFSGKKYFTVENFLDENIIKSKGNSRFLRFDPNIKNFVEFKDGKDIPLFKGRFKIIKNNKGEYNFLQFTGRKWVLKYSFRKGIGIVKAKVNGNSFILNRVNFNINESDTKLGDNFSDIDENLILIEKGGFQKKDILCSIWGNGSIVIVKKGKIVYQGPIDKKKFYSLLKKIYNAGFLELRNFYGKDAVYYPLTIKIELKGKNNKVVVVKTSEKDKPPISFWDIVDLINNFANRERKAYEK